MSEKDSQSRHWIFRNLANRLAAISPAGASDNSPWRKPWDVRSHQAPEGRKIRAAGVRKRPNTKRHSYARTGRARLCGALLAAALCLISCSKFAPLHILGSVPRFQLTDQSGQAFDSSTLAGHVWVANFIYTTCPGPCPMMSSKMHGLQVATSNFPDIKLISFTVDPADDTPPVLAEYSKRFAADSSRWTFLTGEQAKLNDLGVNAFHLNTVDGSLIHSTRFALVDRQGRIRGYYASDEPGFHDALLRDLRRMEALKS